MIYPTDEARKSAIETIDGLIIDLATSEGVVKDLGYEKTSTAVKFLKMFQRMIEIEQKPES